MKTLIFLLTFLTSICFAQPAPNYSVALAMSAKDKKPIAITVVTTTCPWCHKLLNDTFKDPEVAKVMQDKFITLTLNKDIDDIPSQLKARLAPTTFFLNSKGEKISQTAIGFFEPKDFLEFLDDALKKSVK